MMFKFMFPMLIAAAIFFIDGPTLIKIKKSNKKDLWIYLGLISFGFILLIIQILGKTIPTPLEWISFLLRPMTDGL
ncbi:hypothetical protein J2X07_000545 [Fictibacillus barbaricus]|uniref:Uncharacterized protein n=1 Tax=Fictibacillus barbaricus TaxID=182136 RepID=A0ABU1TWL7_9BACL|nr:hypothetical protein [Fictibacillus barbaricus]